MKRHVIFIQNVMAGGGAERHIINILNYMVAKGWSAEILLTEMKMDEIVTLFDLDASVKVKSIVESTNSNDRAYKVLFGAEKFVLKCITWFYCHIGLGNRKPKWLIRANYVSENRNAIKKISEVIQKADDSSVLLTVLDAPSFQTIFANKKYGKKHIIAEFADPARKMKASPLATMMFKEYYKRTNRIIFQTPGAMAAFDSEVQKKGIIIPNPLSEKLPEPYFGSREKTIVNFCRFSEQKNIPLLLKAFRMLHDDFGEYHLIIYGSATNDEEKKCLQECNDLANDLGLQQSVSFPGFSYNVHEKIMDATMFVSSSDYEGLSNSMIEAMALGLPVVSTDCPAGGASYIIENEVNGLLTPVGDVESLYKAMKRIISDKELALKLSYNAIHVRERLKLGKIADEWMEAFDV